MQVDRTDLARKLDISYRLLFERNPLPMCVYEVGSLGLLAVNDAAVAQYGYSKDEFVGLTLLDLHHAQDLPAVQERLNLPPDQQPPVQMWLHRHRDASAIEVETLTEAFDIEGIHARMMLVRDMREQRQLEREQRELTERLTTTLESIDDGFFTLDQSWCFTYVNARAEAMLQRARRTARLQRLAVLSRCGRRRVPDRVPARRRAEPVGAVRDLLPAAADVVVGGRLPVSPRTHRVFPRRAREAPVRATDPGGA